MYRFLSLPDDIILLECENLIEYQSNNVMCTQLHIIIIHVLYARQEMANLKQEWFSRNTVFLF